MQKTVFKLAAKMLQNYSDILSNEGCSDLSDELIEIGEADKEISARIRCEMGINIDEEPEMFSSFCEIPDTELSKYLGDQLEDAAQNCDNAVTDIDRIESVIKESELHYTCSRAVDSESYEEMLKELITSIKLELSGKG